MHGTVRRRSAATGSVNEAAYSRYVQYIGSAAWRQSPARLEEIEASGRRCRLCNADSGQDQLQVHHRTYERLYAELAEDLTTLCARCHLDVTSILRARKYEGRTPLRADVVRPLASPPPLTDPSYGAFLDQHRIRFVSPYGNTTVTAIATELERSSHLDRPAILRLLERHPVRSPDQARPSKDPRS